MRHCRNRFLESPLRSCDDCGNLFEGGGAMNEKVLAKFVSAAMG